MRYPKVQKNNVIFVGFIMAAFLLGGCAIPSTKKTELPKTQINPASMQARRTLVEPTPLIQHNNGSLWSDNTTLSHMFINAKARRVGDIVTIKIVESSSATNQANTDTDRTTSLDVGLTGFFNLEDRYPATRKFFNPFAPVTSEYTGEFAGSGKTVRSGALTAYITARIIQIMPNGNFVIEGNREVRVNNENQIITLTGIVRPRDISSDNVIQSTYIADARISYSGSGIVNDQQRPGWLTRILDNIWPF